MKYAFVILFALGLVTGLAQSSSVLASGKWYKLSVTEDAVYRIDYNLLKKLGIDPDRIDPKKLQIHAAGNGMLPQPNSAPRVRDLQQLAITVTGQDDGRFNKEDAILFYGQGPDMYQLNPAKGIYYYENNLYSDKNFYFLTVGADDGKRMSTIAHISGNYPTVAEFDDFSYYETEQVNELRSGRDWFGEVFDTKTEYTIRFEIPGIVDITPIKLISAVMGQSFAESSFQLSLNEVAVGEQKIQPIINSQYAVKGAKRSDTLTINSSAVQAASRANQDLKIKFTKAATGRSVAYLDYVLLQTKRTLALYGDQKIFLSLKSLQQPISRFSIASMPANGAVWDITDPFDVKIQETVEQNASFSASSTMLKKYIAVANKNLPAPTSEGLVPNQNIHGITAVDLLIVTAPEFASEAQRLAGHRSSKNSLRVVVTTTTEVYNEFSGGKQDVTAIRDAVKHLFDKKTGIKNLLLMGRGSYDYKNYLTYNKNFVPIYESRNSLSPLETYSSDDYFGFLDNNEGNWGENPPQPHTLEIGVGRLPVKKPEEAKTVVDKLIQYENQNWGSWRKEILFVADDGDFNIHQGQADQMAESIESSDPEFNIEKIYVDAFKQVDSPIGQVSPETTDALVAAVRKGVAIVNFTGHGNEQQWVQERILNQLSLERWTTAPHYPLLVTATCEFGRNDDPGLISTGELSMIKKDGGSIGLVTTARPVNSSTNFTLNKAFYQALFTKDQGNFRDLGSVFRDTKNNSISENANRNFSLLGDPSMKLALPSAEVRISEIKNLSSNSDTVKALSKVRVSGGIYRNGTLDENFNGIATTTLFDKMVPRKTLGDENPPFNYFTRDNALFRGQASVQNGVFSIRFTVPKDIDVTVGTGKLSAYAYSNSRNYDVTGGNALVKVGSAEKNPGTDTQGPSIQLFMGDSTFVNSGIAGKSSRIVAILSDKDGIDISNFREQNAIIAQLDDSATFNLNDYYQADINTVARGKLSYPIDNLKPGPHTLTLRASDVFSNRSATSISFFVTEQAGIQIEQLFNYPNPVTSSTTFRFKHSRSGEDLEATVALYDRVGQLVYSGAYQVSNGPYQVDLPEWDATNGSGTKLSPGLYLLKLSLRSLVDGSKNEKITKIIITN
ncbi:MAG: type IX secretion system sortase PorU [Cyclobacteriaceae bacterium]|nr:type IX secretion system sortase PorU [Cyclobacteriaceae bacterium]